MSVFYPPGVLGTGMDTWTWVVTIATKTAMTAVEAAATGTVNLQGAMRKGFGITSDTNKIEDERQGSLNVYEITGTTKLSFPDMIVIDRPQDAPAGANNKHIDALVPGAAGYLVNRRGIGSAPENWIAWAAGQKYRGYPAQVASVTPLAVGDSGMFELSVSFAVPGAGFVGTTV